MSSGDNMEGVKADRDGQVNSLVLKNAKNAREQAAHSIYLLKMPSPRASDFDIVASR